MDPTGIYIYTTGDNVNPFEADGFTPIDERPGRAYFDAQGTSGNTHDLRGKILRIRPQEDGSYTIPEGNLFATEEEGLPEVYVMGTRNPFRMAVNKLTGELVWGDVGPDAGGDNGARGPKGYDEFNRTSSAGNFGWPFCIAENLPYREYDLPQVTQDQPIIVPNLSIIHRIIPELIPFHPHNLLGLPTTMDLQKSGLN